MIGIIDKELSAYSIIDEIKKKYPTIDIYLIKDETNLDKSIEILKNKNCKIVISPEKISNNDSLYFLTYEDIETTNSYVLDSKELIEAVKNANLAKVDDILNNLDIDNNQVIIINNPILLFIKSKINDKYSNKIISSTEKIINDIESIINEHNFDINGNGNLIEITEK